MSRPLRSRRVFSRTGTTWANFHVASLQRNHVTLNSETGPERCKPLPALESLPAGLALAAKSPNSDG